MSFGRLRSWIIFLAVTLLLVFLSRFGPFAEAIDVIKLPFRSIQSRVYEFTVGADNFVANFFLANQLEKSVQDLTERVIELSRQKVSLTELQSENDQLKELLKFKDEKPDLQLITCRVLNKSSAEPTVLRIDRGSSAGVETGEAVVTRDGLMIGTVISTDDFGAQVLLLSDSRSQVSASLATNNHPVGLVVGDKGLSLQLTLIPNTEEMARGDVIVSSGLDEKIPYGLIIGEVEEVKNQPNELFQNAIIKTLLPLKDATLVAVVKK